MNSHTTINFQNYASLNHDEFLAEKSTPADGTLRIISRAIETVASKSLNCEYTEFTITKVCQTSGQY